MRVILVTGSYPPAVCGVGDYTQRLESALIAGGLQVEIVSDREWSLGSVNRLARCLRHVPLVHIQYPSVGFGYTLGPQALSFTLRPIVTIHEFSHVRVLRRLATSLFFARSRHLIFTAEDERDAACRRAPWIRAKSSVIPIGSNILPPKGTSVRSTGKIIYFGLIAPRKGLESLLEVSTLVRTRHLPYLIEIIGAVPPKFEDYARSLRSASAHLPIVWTLNRSEEEVAKILSESNVAYLPFPDGASDRRGSLKAVLEAGIACITTAGKQTSAGIRRAVRVAESPEQALAIFTELEDSAVSRELLLQEAREYVKSYSWDSIAKSHINLYTQLTETAQRNLRSGSRSFDSKPQSQDGPQRTASEFARRKSGDF